MTKQKEGQFSVVLATTYTRIRVSTYARNTFPRSEKRVRCDPLPALKWHFRSLMSTYQLINLSVNARTAGPLLAQQRSPQCGPRNRGSLGNAINRSPSNDPNNNCPFPETVQKTYSLRIRILESMYEYNTNLSRKHGHFGLRTQWFFQNRSFFAHVPILW